MRVVAAGDEVARGPVAGAHLQQRRVFDVAEAVSGRRAARVEVTAARRLDRAGHVAGEHDRTPQFFGRRVGDGHGREQGLRVRVHRSLVELRVLRELDDAAEVHDGDPVADVAHHGEVVGDEQVGEAELPLQLLQEVDDLRADGDVEGADGLVADDEVGLHRQRPGDADALALAAAELVRDSGSACSG